MSLFLKRYKSVFFLLAASILFGISNSVTAWFCFVPVLFLVHSVRPKTVWLWGALYGCFSYLFYVTWLFTYSASALFGVCFVYAVYCALLFLVLKGAEQFCGKAAPFVQLAVLFAGVIFSYVYGFYKVSAVDKAQAGFRRMSVAAIQHNTDPWKGGIDFYRKDVNSLILLSEQALADHPETELVVWPETSVVPSIMKHYYAPDETERKKLVTELLEFIDGQNAAFLVGNFNVQDGNDYNSAFLFRPGENVLPPAPEVYSKVHLVPFSEYFPYEKMFPHIYRFLLDGDSHLWTPGTERSVFTLNGLSFASPICFEDSFGADCRIFVQNGARAFINMSNDAWAKSSRAQKQHLQNAVFRSVENHIPTVRSTASGVTCIIDSCGRITAECGEFCTGYAFGTIPVIDRPLQQKKK